MMSLRPGQTILRLKKGITSQTIRFKHQPRNLLLLGERGGFVSSSFPPDKTSKFIHFMEENTRVVYAGNFNDVSLIFLKLNGLESQI
jgi:hypothetical protein